VNVYNTFNPTTSTSFYVLNSISDWLLSCLYELTHSNSNINLEHSLTPKKIIFLS